MSVAPVTTVQQSNNDTITTSVTPSNSNHDSPPVVHTRPAGWHAKSFGFDWNKRSDQHKYLIKSGLPEVHAAIVNDDWDLALELICPEDFGLLWLPPASQSPHKNSSTDLDASTWTIDLLSQKEDIRNNAILQMALHNTFVTSAGDNCLYGANLLTLCLLKPAHPNVLQHVIDLAAKEAPKYLNLPDAVGRTPLWIAIENQDHASLNLLLKMGADPLQSCKFSKQAEPKSLLSLAAKSADKQIFCDLLRATVSQEKKFPPYDFNEDPFYLKYWAAGHSSEDVLWLADQLEVVRGPLFCCNDISGSSFFYRSVIDGSLVHKLKNGNEDLISWLRNLDTSPAVSDDLESTPMFAAASQATIQTYIELDDFYFASDKETFCNIEVNTFENPVENKFLLRWTVKDFDHYLDSLPETLKASNSNHKRNFINGQLNILLGNHSELHFDDYARTVKSVWPFISDTEKVQLFVNAALSADDRMELVFGLLDFSIESSTINGLMYKASVYRKKLAFEFAADRSFEMGTVLESLSKGNDTGYGMFLVALTAGSLKWVEKLIAAGINRQKAIADSPTCIYLLADLDPAGLQTKLKGLNYTITELMISHAETEAGKQALMELMTNASNNS
jgi:hypothetical protein